MSVNPSQHMRGSCECGACTFETSSIPRARLICHCTICQAFTGRPFNDVVIVPGSKMTLHNEAGILFRKYKRFRFPPPNLNRGRCSTCGVPVVETFGSGLARLLFVPVRTFLETAPLPAVEGHIFYEHRQQDAHDAAPKHEGYFPSQAAIARMIVHSF